MRVLSKSKLTVAREAEVRAWIADAQGVVASRMEPVMATGSHCEDPCACGFLAYCQSREAPVEFPVSWLPRVYRRTLKDHLEHQHVTSLKDVPDELLNDRQLRVKQCSLSGQPFFDAAGAAAALAPQGSPAFSLDFEAVSFAVLVGSARGSL